MTNAPSHVRPSRRKHYVAEPRGNFQMTERARLILSLLGPDGFRLLRTTHILELLRYYLGENSDQRTIRLLRMLHDHKHVIRIRNDPDSASIAHGSLDKIYGLLNRKNQALNERRDKASKVVPHALSTATSIIFNVIRPCRLSHGAFRYMDHEEILATLAPEQTRQARKPLTWSVQVHFQNGYRTVGITPDKLFIVHAPQRVAGRMAFVWEEDMKTEPIIRKNLEGTAIYQKHLAYGFSHATRLLLDRFGIPGFRALFVTNSRERAEHMVAAFELLNEELKAAGLKTCPPNTFHYIDRPTLRAGGTIFSVPWINGHGKQVMIEPPSSAAPQLSAVG